MDNEKNNEGPKAVTVEKDTGQVTIKAEHIPTAKIKISIVMLFLSLTSVCTSVFFVTREYFSIKNELSTAQKDISKFQEQINLEQKIRMENILSNLDNINIDDCDIIKEAVTSLKTKQVKNNCK